MLPAARRVFVSSVCVDVAVFFLLPSIACLLTSLSHPPSPPHASLVCTCAPYHTCSIPHHLASLIPCIPIPSAAPPTTNLALDSEHRPCHPLARTSFLPAPPRAQESVGAAWLDLAHVRRPPGLPPRTYQSSPAASSYSSSPSFFLRRHLQEALTRPLTFLPLLYM